MRRHKSRKGNETRKNILKAMHDSKIGAKRVRKDGGSGETK
jgi:hypothetical protein